MMVRRKRIRRQIETGFYVLELDTWDWSLSFGIAHRKDLDDPYSDFRHIELVGRLLSPRNVKIDTASCTLLPNVDLNEANRERHQPKAVGSVSLRRGAFRALLSTPADALPSILSALTTARLRYVAMTGDPLRYGQAMVRYFSISTTFDEGELPEE